LAPTAVSTDPQLEVLEIPTLDLPVEPSVWRGSGVWVQAKSITTPADIDAVLERAVAGGFHAIFVNVYVNGETLYRSALAYKYDKVAPDIDPLAYLVPEAHKRGIEVHAWFVVGLIGEGYSPLSSMYPDWGLMGPDGETTPWLNLVRPDVRQFISDLMLEVVEQYGVDGLHFDYTRYPGNKWGFDPYTIEAFTQAAGYDLDLLRYAELPAYGVFEGNPLAGPGTAQILASFSNGYPAVTLNRYGDGEVLVLNWNANERVVAAGGEIMQRGLQYLNNGGQVYVLNSETNAVEYGREDFDLAMNWLASLGWEPLEAGEAAIQYLEPESVLVLPNVYLISAETAKALASFVSQGGGVVFIDGPTKSMQVAEIRAITGMLSRGSHFKEYALMTASGEHPLIPVSERDANLASYQARDEQWKAFRRQNINLLIRDVYARIKSTHPEVYISVTVTSDQHDAADRYMQDWQAWLQEGYIDFLVPRGYVDEVGDLHTLLDDWGPVIQTHDSRIVMGVIAYFTESDSNSSKSSGQLLAEINLVNEAGSESFLVFDLEHISDEQLSALKDLPRPSAANP